MQLLPDLSERLASDLINIVARVAEPGRGQIESMLTEVSHSTRVNLEAGLAQWLAGMRPGVMVECYIQMRQLIRFAEEIIHEERHG